MFLLLLSRREIWPRVTRLRLPLSVRLRFLAISIFCVEPWLWLATHVLTKEETLAIPRLFLSNLLSTLLIAMIEAHWPLIYVYAVVFSTLRRRPDDSLLALLVLFRVPRSDTSSRCGAVFSCRMSILDFFFFSPSEVFRMVAIDELVGAVK